MLSAEEFTLHLLGADLSMFLYIEENETGALEETVAYKAGLLAGRQGLGPDCNIYDLDRMQSSHAKFEAGRKAGLEETKQK